MKKGGIKKMFLLSLAMFIAGYLAAVATLSPEALKADQDNPDYSKKLSNVTGEIKDVVKEHGTKAYGEIAEFLATIKEDDQDNESEDSPPAEESAK